MDGDQSVVIASDEEDSALLGYSHYCIIIINVD